jgi:hypothetical protein
MTFKFKYVRAVWSCLLILFTALPASAIEQTKIDSVWKVGARQQYLYYVNGELAGESWMEIRLVPKTRDRYIMRNDVKIDALHLGSPLKLRGYSEAELDPWGRPVSYDLELIRANGTTTMNILFNFPGADLTIQSPGEEERFDNPRFNEESRLLDFVFIGPFDLAFRLDPVHPAAEKVRRNYFVPQLEVNILTDFLVKGEEIITMNDGTKVPTVYVEMGPLLTNVWLDPDGRVVKAVVPSENLEMRLGERVEP